MTNISFRVDSIRNRRDLSPLIHDLFENAGDQVSRPQDHLFLFLHCLMLESGFCHDHAASGASSWSQGDWKPQLGKRSCYSTCYYIDNDGAAKVTLRMTPVGSTLLVIANSEQSELSADAASFSTSSIRTSNYIVNANQGDYVNLTELAFIFKESISRPLFAFIHNAIGVSLPETFLTGLNPVVMMEILRRIRNAESLKALASVNKQFYQTIANNQCLWKTLLLRDFPREMYDGTNMRNYFVIKNSKKRV